MKLFIRLAIVMMAMAICAAAQEKIGAAEPTQKDKTEAIPANLFLKRGAADRKGEKGIVGESYAGSEQICRQNGPSGRRYRPVVQDGGLLGRTSSEGECKKCSSKNEGPRVFYSASVRRIICPC